VSNVLAKNYLAISFFLLLDEIIPENNFTFVIARDITFLLEKC
jgi:hypothetical protein